MNVKEAAKEYKNTHKIESWYEDGELVECLTPTDVAFEDGAEFVKNELLHLALKMRIETPVIAKGTPAYPLGRIVGRTEVIDELVSKIESLWQT